MAQLEKTKSKTVQNPVGVFFLRWSAFSFPFLFGDPFLFYSLVLVVFFFLSFPLHSLVASAESANERPLPLPHPTPSTPLKCKKKNSIKNKKKRRKEAEKGAEPRGWRAGGWAAGWWVAGWFWRGAADGSIGVVRSVNEQIIGRRDAAVRTLDAPLSPTPLPVVSARARFQRFVFVLFFFCLFLLCRPIEKAKKNFLLSSRLPGFQPSFRG